MKKVLYPALALVLGALILSAAPVEAKTKGPGIDARQKMQKQRIRQGVQCGELTRRETRQLVQQQRRIHRTECRMKGDGRLNKQERVRLHRMQNNASRNIYAKKHNHRNRK